MSDFQTASTAMLARSWSGTEIRSLIWGRVAQSRVPRRLCGCAPIPADRTHGTLQVPWPSDGARSDSREARACHIAGRFLPAPPRAGLCRPGFAAGVRQETAKDL